MKCKTKAYLMLRFLELHHHCLHGVIKPGLKMELLDGFMKDIFVVVTLPKMAVGSDAIGREVTVEPNY